MLANYSLFSGSMKSKGLSGEGTIKSKNSKIRKEGRSQRAERKNFEKKSLPVMHISHKLHFLLYSSNLLSGGRLRTTETEERHVGGIALVSTGLGNWCFLRGCSSLCVAWFGLRRILRGFVSWFAAGSSFGVCRRFCRAVCCKVLASHCNHQCVLGDVVCHGATRDVSRE